MNTINNLNSYINKTRFKSWGGVLIGLVSLIVLSILSLNLLNNNQVKATAPSGFNVSVDTAAGAVDYTTGTSDGYLGVRVRLVSPSDFSIKSDLSSLRFTFVKSSEIETKCTNINKDDGSAATSHRPAIRTTSTSANYYHSFGTVTNSNQLRVDRVFVKKSQLTDTEEYKICVEIPYHRSGSSEMMYAYVSTSMEFTEAPPKVTKITVKSADYTAADIGKNIEVVYTFDRPIKFVIASKSNNYETYKHNVAPVVANLFGQKTAVGSGAWDSKKLFVRAAVVDNYSNNIVFKLPLNIIFDIDASGKTGFYKALEDEFFETGTNANIHTYVASFGSNDAWDASSDPWAIFDIVDEYGRKAKKDNNFVLVDNPDVNDFKVTLDTTPIVTLKQVTGGFDIMHTPEKFHFIAQNPLYNYDATTPTDQNTITANWTLLKRTTVPKTTDKCETGTGITTVTTGTKAAVKEQMPSTPDDMWYCVHTTDVFTRKVMSSWMKYINDTTGPVISHTVVNNRLTLTVTDAGTGYKEDSLRWGALASDKRCVQGFAGTLESNTMAFNINQDLDNQVICVKAEDNSGNISYKKITLKYNQATTTTPPTDDDEKQEAPKDTSDDDMGEDTDKDQTQTTTTVDCDDLPDNWAQLSVSEKVRLNPCKCEPTKIRADNARCVGDTRTTTTTTTDDGETTTPAPPTTTDDDDDMMDDEDQTDDTQTSSLRLSYDASTQMVMFDATGNLSDYRSAIVDSMDDCNTATYEDLDGDDQASMGIDPADLEAGKTVCVKADNEDGEEVSASLDLSTVNQTTDNQDGDDEQDTTNDNEDNTGTDDNSDDGGNPGLIIGIVVLVIVVIGVIIFMVTKNKNNNQI